MMHALWLVCYQQRQRWGSAACGEAAANQGCSQTKKQQCAVLCCMQPWCTRRVSFGGVIYVVCVHVVVS
jgi:hypothetical protein